MSIKRNYVFLRKLHPSLKLSSGASARPASEGHEEGDPGSRAIESAWRPPFNGVFISGLAGRAPCRLYGRNGAPRSAVVIRTVERANGGAAAKKSAAAEGGGDVGSACHDRPRGVAIAFGAEGGFVRPSCT